MGSGSACPLSVCPQGPGPVKGLYVIGQRHRRSGPGCGEGSGLGMSAVICLPGLAVWLNHQLGLLSTLNCNPGHRSGRTGPALN